MGRSDPLRRIIGATRRTPDWHRRPPRWIGQWSPVAPVVEVLECGHLGPRLHDPYAPPHLHTPIMRGWRWEAAVEPGSWGGSRWWATTDIFDGRPARRRCVECGMEDATDMLVDTANAGAALTERLGASLTMARGRRHGHLRVIDGGAA